MSESKQRLRPWLENVLNENLVPGVCWINDEKNQFKVPWKHHGKQDWTESDAEIFMRWARHTGKYREDIDNKEFATWKTRLRCALNKAPDIEELKEKSQLDCPNPFRVYLLKHKRETVRRPGQGACSLPVVRNQRSIECTIVNTSAQQGELPSMLADLESGEAQTSSLTTKINSGDLLQLAESNVTDLGSLPSKTDFSFITEPHTGQDFPAAHLPHNFVPPQTILPAFKSEFAQTGSQPTFAESQQEAGACAQDVETEFTVKLLYNNILENKTMYKVSASCSLRCQSDDQLQLDEEQRQQVNENLYGPKDFPEIYFENHDESKKSIFDNLSRGVTIQCNSNGDLYVTRYCKLQVFHASEVFTENSCHKISRSSASGTLVFRTENEFNLAVQNYLNGEIVSPPSPDVYLLFGKQVDDITDDEQKKNVHFIAVVTTTKAKNLIEKAKLQMRQKQGMDLSEDIENLTIKDEGESVCISKSDDWDNIQQLLKDSPQIVPVDESSLQTIPETGESLLCSDLQASNTPNNLEEFFVNMDEMATEQFDDVQ